MLADNETSIAEKDLVIRCQRGDRLAFRQLYRRYQHRVRSTLYQLCGKEMLDDLVQEVFLRVWKALPTLRQPAYFASWLYRITWNVATDKRRDLAKQPPVQQAISHYDEDAPLLSQTLSRPQDTLDLMKIHYQDIVSRGLQSLSLEHRAVLVLHDLEDLPQKEVAQVLQLPVGTVKSRLHYARHALKNFLQREGVL